jgi:hypothetical protein
VLDLDDGRKLAIETTIEPMIKAAQVRGEELAPDLILDDED